MYTEASSLSSTESFEAGEYTITYSDGTTKTEWRKIGLTYDQSGPGKDYGGRYYKGKSKKIDAYKYYQNQNKVEKSTTKNIGYNRIITNKATVNGTDYVTLEGIVYWYKLSDLVAQDGYKENGGNPYYIGFDTGGYTGVWGPEGRLAMLHQKELVLNSKDTENILSSVELLRSMSGEIGKSIIDKVNGVVANLSVALQATRGGTGGDSVVQQAVAIEANFPGVSSAAEIEQALNNLVNDAAQYASQKKD